MKKRYDRKTIKKFYRLATRTAKEIIINNSEFRKKCDNKNRIEKILENENYILFKKPFPFLDKNNEIYLYDIFSKNLNKKLYYNIYSYKLSKFIFNKIKDKIILKNSEFEFLLHIDYKCFSIYKDLLLINYKIKKENNNFKKTVLESRYDQLLFNYNNYRKELFYLINKKI